MFNHYYPVLPRATYVGRGISAVVEMGYSWLNLKTRTSGKSFRVVGVQVLLVGATKEEARFGIESYDEFLGFPLTSSRSVA